MDFSESKWIWADGNTVKRDRVIFRRAFTLEKPPKSATLDVCVFDRANIYVNGEPVAIGASGCRSFDITKKLSKGNNVLGFDCTYYGEPANGYEPPESSGLIVSCKELAIYSDKSFVVHRPFAEDCGEPRPSGRYWGFDCYTDGGRGELGDVFEAEYGSTLFSPATEHGEGGVIFEENSQTGLVYEKTVRAKKFAKSTEGVIHTYEFDLGEEKIFCPVLELAAMGTERIEIKTDRYTSLGKWGDDGEYTGTRGVYICRNGTQKYTCPVPMHGSKVTVIAPATVTVRSLDLMFAAYPVRRVLHYSGDRNIETLLDKCDNTMRACMDGGMLNNSDRDRGCDLFALSVFARAALVTYDDSVLPLVRAAILGAVPENGALENFARGPFAYEDVISSLAFCSRLGAVAAYYMRTADVQLLTEIYEALCSYLMRWEFGYDGLVSRLKEGERADAGYNCDPQLIEICLYYSAASFLAEVAGDIANFEHEGELRRRADLILTAFGAKYYKGGYFSSGEICDERANALAVLCGLAGGKSAEIADALASCNNASPAYEGFVIDALAAVGRTAQAKDRLVRRSLGFIESESPVLPEYFYRAGSACSVSSVSLLCGFIGGVLGVNYSACRKASIIPPADCGDFKAEIAFGDDCLRLSCKRGVISADNSSGCSAELYENGETFILEKGKKKRIEE